MSLLVCGVIALFFGLLIGGFFELFGLLDFLLSRTWPLSMSNVTLLLATFVIAVLLIRIAWRIALVLMGLLTPKYDEPMDAHVTVPLDCETHSMLYDMVGDVCHRVQAPQPDEVRLAGVAECYVVEQRQFSLRTNRQLILVLGLPELLMLTIAEVRVIVAHELVHFRNHHTTAVVFLFRFLESLRQTWEPLQGRRWHRADPIYWLFWGFYHLVSWLCQPIQRYHELHADAVSAAAYGGDPAASTLLKDWLLANEFDNAVEDFRCRLADGQVSASGNVYRFFVDRAREFSSESLTYLEKRFLDEPEADADEDRPSMRRRLLLLRSFPSESRSDSRPATELLPDLTLLQDQLHRLLIGAGETTARSAENPTGVSADNS